MATGFDNNIFGLGRDDDGSLHQRISHSVINSGTTTTAGQHLMVSTNNNFTALNTLSNHPNISGNLSFVIHSDNGAVFANYTNQLAGLTDTYRSDRIWQVQSTGDPASRFITRQPKQTCSLNK